MKHENECCHCRWSSAAQGGLQCRRMPPQTHLVPTQHPISGQQGIALQSVFPIVDATQWCGEFMVTLHVLDNAS